jgi:hypothetical protein
MAIDKPTAGNLIKTVDDLVTVVNAGGSGSLSYASLSTSEELSGGDGDFQAAVLIIDQISGEDFYLINSTTFNIAPGAYLISVSAHLDGVGITSVQVSLGTQGAILPYDGPGSLKINDTLLTGTLQLATNIGSETQIYVTGHGASWTASPGSVAFDIVKIA